MLQVIKIVSRQKPLFKRALGADRTAGAGLRTDWKASPWILTMKPVCAAC
jgi:hypothetical protein